MVSAALPVADAPQVQHLEVSAGANGKTCNIDINLEKRDGKVIISMTDNSSCFLVLKKSQQVLNECVKAIQFKGIHMLKSHQEDRQPLSQQEHHLAFYNNSPRNFRFPQQVSSGLLLFEGRQSQAWSSKKGEEREEREEIGNVTHYYYYRQSFPPSPCFNPRLNYLQSQSLYPTFICWRSREVQMGFSH